VTIPLLARARAAATPARTAAGAAVAVALAALVAVAGLLDGIGENGDLSVLDRPLLAWLVGHRDPVLTTVATAVTTAGGVPVLASIAVLAVAALAWRRRYDEALLLSLALGGAEAIAYVLKHVVGRARPPASDVLGPVEATLSFPSGHTVGTAAFTLALAYLWWRRRPGRRRALAGLAGAAAATVVMAASRLYLGDHWLTDVLGGAALAVGVMGLVVLVDLWLRRHGPGWARGPVAIGAVLLDERGVVPTDHGGADRP
jgi:undecaprenyl-diphosphatase